MKIYLANRGFDFKEGATIKDVVGENEFCRILCVWVNGKRILEEEYCTYALEDNDRIKVQRTLGGG